MTILSDMYPRLKYDREHKNNLTMASAASPGAANPKMAELCNHMAHASSHYACTEDGYFNSLTPKSVPAVAKKYFLVGTYSMST